MSDMLKIVNLNGYIQHVGKLYLLDKEVLCVALDRTCTFRSVGEEDSIALTDDQLEDLWRQVNG